MTARPDLRTPDGLLDDPAAEPDRAPPPTRSRSRRLLRRIGIGFGVLVAVYVVLVVVSRLMIDGRDDVAFFEPRPGDHHPLVVAHQGGEGRWPSNTMLAFRSSIDVGADVLDADAHLTRDGVLVLIHDSTVDRTSDGSGAVRDMTLAELRELDFGYRFTPDDGATFPYRGSGLTIVTVDELFREFAETRFGIEIKPEGPDGAVAATELCTSIEQHGLVDRVLVSSFSQTSMDAFRFACPDVATSATDPEAKRFYILQLVRLSGFASPDYDSLQVPEYRSGRHVLSGSFVSAAGRWNLPIVPWTIDEPADMERLIDEVDPAGINTNFPDLLVDHVDGG